MNDSMNSFENRVFFKKNFRFLRCYNIDEAKWPNDATKRMPKYSQKNPVPVPLCPTYVPHIQTWDRPKTSAVKSNEQYNCQRLTKKTV
jgi:hypothetical protein